MVNQCAIESYGEGEVARVHDRKIQKARKEHICYECGNSIRSGDSYEYLRGLWDEWSTVKTCSVCLELRDKLFCSFICGSVMYDLAYELLEEDTIGLSCFDGLSEEAINRIDEILFEEKYYS